MPQLYPAAIQGTGAYVPQKILTNADLSKMVDTSEEWIFSRTGIRQRRIASTGEAASDLGLAASRRALEAAECNPKDIDLVLCATISGDQPFPATACILQHELGIRHVGAFDLSAACSGFIYGISVARQYIATGAARKVLLVGSEVLSRFTDFTDRATCILFGDGAGAVVLGRAEDGGARIVNALMAADGSGVEMLKIPGGGSRLPITIDNIDEKLPYIRMQGREVYKFAVQALVRCCREATEDAGVALSDVNCIVPHQVNLRIFQAAAKRLKIPVERIYQNLEKYGNTSAASIPIALDEAVRDNTIQKGDLVLLVGFGGGLTWSSSLIRW
jgi:3-oxoacyl-[acyl-carrier-protein] synthase-3